jgi:hypothetical protein
MSSSAYTLWFSLLKIRITADNVHCGTSKGEQLVAVGRRSRWPVAQRSAAASCVRACVACFHLFSTLLVRRGQMNLVPGSW